MIQGLYVHSRYSAFFPQKVKHNSYKLSCIYADFFMLSFDSFSDSDNLESALLLLRNSFSVLAGC